MSWVATGVGVAAVGTGASMYSASKKKPPQQTTMRLETPEQRMMREAVTRAALARMAGQVTPEEQAQMNLASTTADRGVANAMQTATNNPVLAQGGGMYNMYNQATEAALKQRIAANVGIRSKGYDDSFHAGLQLAMGTPAKGSQTTGVDNSKADMWEALGGGAGAIGGLMMGGGGTPAAATAGKAPPIDLTKSTWTPDYANDPNWQIRR
jgi:hypothetical protein